MPATRISNNFSHASLRLVCARIADERIVGHSFATGFLWRQQGAAYLVTNVHNVTGWDFIRSQAMSSAGWLPTHVTMPISTRTRRDDLGPEVFDRTTLPVVIDLFDSNGEPCWWVHPTLRETVDVAVLPLSNMRLAAPGSLDGEWATLAVNEVPELRDFELDAGDDAFVLGFPKALDGGGGFPIWKRASIASEPGFDIDGHPKLLIDTATREGMSGSPVFGIRRGLVKFRNGQESIGQALTFVGVYSGRIGDDSLGAQLGIVWKGRVIDEIIAEKVHGRSPP